MKYKALGKMQNAEYEYVFCDDGKVVKSKSESFAGEGKLVYAMIPKAVETSGYLMVYQSKTQAYIVDKATITNGTMEEIREKLAHQLQKNYVICRW